MRTSDVREEDVPIRVFLFFFFFFCSQSSIRRVDLSGRPCTANNKRSPHHRHPQSSVFFLFYSIPTGSCSFSLAPVGGLLRWRCFLSFSSLLFFFFYLSFSLSLSLSLSLCVAFTCPRRGGGLWRRKNGVSCHSPSVTMTKTGPKWFFPKEKKWNKRLRAVFTGVGGSIASLFTGFLLGFNCIGLFFCSRTVIW